MAENETLIHEERSASRFHPVTLMLDQGRSLVEVFPEMERGLYAIFKHAWKRWRANGVEPRELFKAALNDPQALQRLIRQSGNDPNARLLADVASDLGFPDLKTLVKGFLNRVWEDVERQVQVNRRHDDRPLDYMLLSQKLIGRIMNKLQKNLSRFPNPPSQKKPPPDLDTQLGQSLLQ